MYFISDWAILNSINSKQLQRILAFDHLSESTIDFACILLESYHAVYRRDRLEQRRQLLKSASRSPANCLTPTPRQLSKIAGKIAATTVQMSNQEVLEALQNLANTVQQYRFNIGLGQTSSLLVADLTEVDCV